MDKLQSMDGLVAVHAFLLGKFEGRSFSLTPNENEYDCIGLNTK